MNKPNPAKQRRPQARPRPPRATPGTPHIGLRILADSVIAIGPGKADLLEAIASTGSISAAARTMGMSYRRAWLLVDTMNKCFVDALVSTEKGGVEGGGASLTPTGRKVLRKYREIANLVAKGFRPLLGSSGAAR